MKLGSPLAARITSSGSDLDVFREIVQAVGIQVLERREPGQEPSDLLGPRRVV